MGAPGLTTHVKASSWCQRTGQYSRPKTLSVLPRLCTQILGTATGRSSSDHCHQTQPEQGCFSSSAAGPAILAGPGGQQTSPLGWSGGRRLRGPREGHRCVSRQPGVEGAGRAQGCGLDEDAVIGREGPEESQPLGGDHQELPFSPIPHPPLKSGPLLNSPSALSGQQSTPHTFPTVPFPQNILLTPELRYDPQEAAGKLL